MSIINRNNYEEFFLLYVDDELTAAERLAVEEFVYNHPDLKIELEMLQRSILPAENLVFHDKDSLLRNNSALVNEGNYEEYFVLYADEELTDDQKDHVEQFVYQNPRFRAEFELIQKVKMQPETDVVFPDKSLLYRTEIEHEKVYVLPWWKMAAAAIVFIFLSGLGWYIVSREKSAPGIVNNQPAEKTGSPVATDKHPKAEEIAHTAPNAANSAVARDVKPIEAKKERKVNIVRKSERQVQGEMLTKTEVPEKDIERRNIQTAKNVTVEKPEVKMGKIEQLSSLTLQNQSKMIVDEGVGAINENEYAFTASNNEIEILNTTVSKKNKLRGLFRKVSRVVEKTTSIDPGDVRGIRIANIEIAVK